MFSPKYPAVSLCITNTKLFIFGNNFMTFMNTYLKMCLNTYHVLNNFTSSDLLICAKYIKKIFLFVYNNYCEFY